MTGFMDMASDEVTAAGQRLAGNGTALGEAWRVRCAAIAASEGGIGADRLADAFRAVYTADSAVVRAAADPVPGLLVADGELARTCADEYRAADDRSADHLRPVSGPELHLPVAPTHADTL